MGSFYPLLALVCPPPALHCPRGSLQRFPPPGQLFHSGGVISPRQLEPPSHSLTIPPGIFCHSGGLALPLLRLPLQRTRRPCFPAVRKPSTFPAFIPHGSLPLPLRLLPWQSRLMWRLRRPLHPLDRFLRRFPPVPLLSASASFRPPTPPLRSRPSPLKLTHPSPLCSTWCCRLRSPPCPS